MTKQAVPWIPPWDATQFNKERRSWEEKCDVKVSRRSRARWKWELSLPLLSALFNVNFAIDWRAMPGFSPNFPRHPVSYSHILNTSIQWLTLNQMNSQTLLYIPQEWSYYQKLNVYNSATMQKHTIGSVMWV